MIGSAFADMESLRVGSVVYASPDAIEIQLEIDAPDSVALNAKTPRRFPRINSYLLVPNDVGFTVGQVSWIKVVNSPYPKRKGLKDFGLIDLPFPLRTLSLSPIGTLLKELDATRQTGQKFIFKRGVESFPSVGDGVLLPTNDQLAAIVTSGKYLRVKIGTSPLAANADVKVDPDRLFGRHLAVLGNTGSGKSCSVAGLIRWSLEAAEKELGGKTKWPNSKFIILDPNGEYASAFADQGAKVFSVDPQKGCSQLCLPHWFLNGEEWCALVQASEKVQRPVLMQALRLVKAGFSEAPSLAILDKRNVIRTHIATIRYEKSIGAPWGEFPKPKAFLERLQKVRSDFTPHSEFSSDQNKALSAIQNLMQKLIDDRSKPYSSPVFSQGEVDQLIDCLVSAHNAFGGSLSDMGHEQDSNIPTQFSCSSFVEAIVAAAEFANATAHTETLLLRVKTLLNDEKLKKVMFDVNGPSLNNWFSTLLGETSDYTVTILDLSLLPSSVVHTVTAVISRLVFEVLQRYRKVSKSHSALPIVLVVEEAHTFVKRYNNDSDFQNGENLCRKTFERIAREGRKFGLSLVLSSQRPSELSPTVLSQCNSFLLHRITNDKDQELIRKLLPDNFQGLLRDLPTLPARNAILLGWAAELPTLVRMNELALSHQPQSQDPHFWDVWTRCEMPDTDWQTIADDWQGQNASPPSAEENVP